ncbi:acetolactate synthase small subunit [Flavobacterium supellecticarium]|uniref:Acetolactate synthase small subunit n=1 Tax=Flavobacterium supellecticarium TaxID=2565924 RepID=A0A4S3ZQX2_9FLAO|nr:acetolactate synthase small subunit [Flavobacterium supellecticarium]THF47912.1 acetolactate synthase small subunit [Flavobacterium supellecticarium]
MNRKQEFTITIYTENANGLINRIALLFFKMKININSINAGPTEVSDIQRFTIVVVDTDDTIRKLAYLLEKQVDVLKVYYYTNEELIWQEMALYKVPTKIMVSRTQGIQILREYKISILVIRKDYTVFEVTGHRDEINELMEVLKPLGLEEFSISSRIAVAKNGYGLHRIMGK